MNGDETHEWRITQLEARMEKLEVKITNATYCLIGNLVGVVLLLLMRIVTGK